MGKVFCVFGADSSFLGADSSSKCVFGADSSSKLVYLTPTEKLRMIDQKLMPDIP